MKNIIIDNLHLIQKEKKIKILYACESGSRGWEFPSPDSDYDVRFIYIKPINDYLSVIEKEDALGFPINGELDIYGWDLRKILQLIRKSNTTPFEWLQSPIVYSEEEGFKNDLWSLCQHFFNQRSNIHHYLGIAKGAMESIINGDEIKIKKLFYVLRPLLSAKWCLEKNSIAPMTIAPLMTLLPDDLSKQVNELIKLKATSPEGFIIKIDAALQSWIQTEFLNCSEASKDLIKDNFEVDKLNDFFLKMIKQYDNSRTKRQETDTF